MARLTSVILALFAAGAAAQAPTTLRYRDCSKQANKVEFVIQGKPGTTNWKNNKPDFNFWYNFDTQKIAAVKTATTADYNEWTASPSFLMTLKKKFAIRIDDNDVNHAGTCTNAAGRWDIAVGGLYYMQDKDATDCKATCAGFVETNSAPKKIRFVDCSGEVGDVMFNFQDKPGTLAKSPLDKTKLWWWDTQSIQATKVPGVNADGHTEWEVDPGFQVQLGRKFKIWMDGTRLDYDGGCTDENGNFRVAHGYHGGNQRVYLQPPYNASCEARCVPFQTYSYFDCSGEATDVKFVFGGVTLAAQQVEHSKVSKKRGGVRWQVKSNNPLVIGSKYQLFVNGVQMKHDGTCTDANGDFTVKWKRDVYLQLPDRQSCDETCKTWSKNPPPKTLSWFDCSNKAQSVASVVEGKPGTIGWCKPSVCKRDPKTFWSDVATHLTQWQKVPGTGTSLSNPARFDFTPTWDMNINKRVKLFIDGIMFTHDGGCTDKGGRFRIPPAVPAGETSAGLTSQAKWYLQNPDETTACKDTCTGFVGTPRAAQTFTWVDCSKTATKVEYVFQGKPGTKDWDKSKSPDIWSTWKSQRMPADKVEGTNMWSVTPNWEVSVGVWYKIRVDGKVIKHSGGCTDQNGRFKADASGTRYLQPRNFPKQCFMNCDKVQLAPTPAPKPCHYPCVYEGGQDSCQVRAIWQMVNVAPFTAEAAIAKINTECAGFCQCTVADLNKPTPAPPTMPPTWAPPTWAPPTWGPPTWAPPTWGPPTWAPPTWQPPTPQSVDSQVDSMANTDKTDGGGGSSMGAVAGAVVGVLVLVAAGITVYMLKGGNKGTKLNGDRKAMAMAMQNAPTGGQAAAGVAI